MKYAIVIPDGCADEPQEALGGKTPLQAAHKPNMDRIAQMGVVGRSNNVPPSLTPASDVATLSLFGYDPVPIYTGRAPLETAAMGIGLGPHDWAIRCNLVTVEQEQMRDFTAGHITNEHGQALMEAVQQALGGPFRKDCRATGPAGSSSMPASAIATSWSIAVRRPGPSERIRRLSRRTIFPISLFAITCRGDRAAICCGP